MSSCRRSALVAMLVGACAQDGGDSDPGELPPEETAPTDSDSGSDTFTFDTFYGDTGLDDAPKHLLTMTHVGSWDMTFSAGEWVSMVGSLAVTEVVDGDIDAPTCELVYALTGAQALSACDGCDAAFEIEYYLTEGDRTLCADPELPESGEVLRMGWNDPEEMIYLDYQRSGVWLAWYPGQGAGQYVTFDWEKTVGVKVVEDDG